MADDRGSWIQAHSGIRFHFATPRKAEVTIDDIAHALAQKTRFNGHLSRFYSVAQHSLIVSRNVPEQHALWGLLHDAGETWLPDIPTPIKNHVYVDFPVSGVRPATFSDLEDSILLVVAARFGLPWPCPPCVKGADKACCLAEKRDLMQIQLEWELIRGDPLAERIVPLPWQAAETLFLARFHDLTGGNTP